MKKQLQELRTQIIKMIVEGDYNVKSTGFNGEYFRIEIEIEGVGFSYSIPSHKRLMIGHSNIVEVFNGQDDAEIAILLYNRHAKEVKREEIQRQIEALQKELA